MGLGHSPRIVTDGLVLALDAANPKNYNLTAVEVLVVAGGGGGGSHHGGGGGAGGLIYNSNFAVTPGSALTVTVGGGGAGGGNSAAGTSPNGGGNGGNSVFGSLTAIGGGGGGSYSNNGSSGGSGGGANNWSVSATGGSGTSGQGFSGASNNGQTNYGGGGGGAGGTAKGLSNNSGGDGLQFPQFASVGGSPAGWFAGGGAAGVYPGYTNDTSYGTGGLGGGGNGGNGPHESGSGKTSGVDNTGGGGGGSADLYQNGAAGGSGIVIVRYPGPQRAIGGTVTSVGGHTTHTFTTVGSTTFTPLAATNNSAILGLADFSGNNNFGTTANSPTYSSANGGSIGFDGSNDYVEFTTTSIQTICFWGRMDSDIPNLAGLVCTSSGGDGALRTNPAGTFRTSPDGNDFHNGFVSSFMINGVSNLSDDGSGGFVIPNGRTLQQDFYVGAIGNARDISTISHTFLGRVYKGKVYAVFLYNRQLSNEELLQNFNALRGRFGI
jgi:hypothetical protein